MGVVITCANQKGGVAKSTTLGALAYILKQKGKKVLCIDLDPQRNLDMLAGKGVAIKRNDIETPSMLDVFTGNKKISEVIVQTDIGDLARASSQLSGWTGANTVLVTKSEYEQYVNDPDSLMSLIGSRLTQNDLESSDKAHVLEYALAEIKDLYDYILIDTNPSLMLLTLNGLYAADYILIPAFAEESSKQAIMELWDTIQGILYYDPSKYLKIAGVLITRYNERTINGRRYLKQLNKVAEKMNTIVFKTKIRNSVSASECMGQEENIVSYDPRSKASIDYQAFVEEVLQQIERLEGSRNG